MMDWEHESWWDSVCKHCPAEEGLAHPRGRILFTCKICETRNSHMISRPSFVREKGPAMLCCQYWESFGKAGIPTGHCDRHLPVTQFLVMCFQLKIHGWNPSSLWYLLVWASSQYKELFWESVALGFGFWRCKAASCFRPWLQQPAFAGWQDRFDAQGSKTVVFLNRNQQNIGLDLWRDQTFVDLWMFYFTDFRQEATFAGEANDAFFPFLPKKTPDLRSLLRLAGLGYLGCRATCSTRCLSALGLCIVVYGMTWTTISKDGTRTKEPWTKTQFNKPR